MNTLIREYNSSDYADCRALFGELAQHHADIYGDQSIAGDDPGRGFDQFLTRNDRCGTWIAESNGRIIGMAGLLTVVGENGVAEIEPLVVSMSSRNTGIGSKLVEYIKTEAKKKGYKFLTIRPELRNEKAFDLYIRLGFNLVGQVELFQDLLPERGRTWQSGVEILGHKLRY